MRTLQPPEEGGVDVEALARRVPNALSAGHQAGKSTGESSLVGCF